MKKTLLDVFTILYLRCRGDDNSNSYPESTLRTK
jgi:hypothetical protein